MLYASWEYVQTGAYWEAGLQLLLLLLLPVVYRHLNTLPTRADFTPDYLRIETHAGVEDIPLTAIQSIDSAFFWLNQRGMFWVRYADAQGQRRTLLTLGGRALAQLAAYRR